MTQTKTKAQVGDVRTWDYQSDIFQGEYKLVENLGGSLWRAEHLPPSEAVIDRILEVAVNGRPGQWMTTIEEVECEIADRVRRAGTTFEIRLVSLRQWAEMF